jgi:biotin transport system substrate-specific component
MREQSRTRSIVLGGLAIALLAVAAQIQLPIGPVPFTLQTLVLILLVLVLTPAESLAAVGGYLLLGAFGLPVFAGFKGGLGVLLGPTGGFLVGFFVGTLLIAGLRWLLDKYRATHQQERGMVAALALDVAAILVIILAYDCLGLAWGVYSTGMSLAAALPVFLLPFLLPDIIKAIAAFICAQPVRAALGRSVARPTQPEGCSKL